MVARSRGGSGSLGDARGSLSIDSSGVQKGVDSAVRSLQGFERSVAGLNRGVAGAARSLSGLGQSAGVAAAGLSRAAANMSGFGLAVAGIERAAGAAAIALGAVAAAGVAAGAASLKTAKDFEQQVSAVAAVANLSQSELQAVRGLALQLGKDTAFSASQAAAGIEELVKGGVTVQQVFAGAAQATLDLAAAGGTTLPEAAQLISTALNAFQLTGDQAVRAANQLAGAANVSATDLRQLGFSMAQASNAAAGLGLNLEDTAAALAVLANRGLRGSDAGTSLRTFLLNLIPQTKEQIALMRELGLSVERTADAFFDAEGNAKGLPEIADALNRAVGGLSKQRRLQVLEQLFGQDAVRAALILAESGGQIVRNTKAQIEAITAADVARTRLDNLAGSMEQLRGSAETAAIMFGSLFIPAVRGGVEAATRQINLLIGVLERLETTLPDLGTAAGQAFGRLTGASQDVGKLEGVLNAVFGEQSGVARGITAFIDATRGLGGIAATNIKAFAGALGLTSAPVKGLLDGLGELGRTIGAEIDKIFNPQQARKAGEWADATTQIAEASERALTPVARFLRLMDDLGRRIQANPQIRALAGAFDALWEAGGKLLGAIKDLALAFLKPFIPVGAAGDVNGLLIALGKLGEGSAADKARVILDLLGKAVDAVATGLKGIAGFVDTGAEALSRFAKRIDQSGAVNDLVIALGKLRDVVVPTADALLKLAGIDLSKLFKAPEARDNAALVNEALLGGAAARRFEQDGALVQTSANVVIAAIQGIGRAADEARGQVRSFIAIVAELDHELAKRPVTGGETGGIFAFAQGAAKQLDEAAAAASNFGKQIRLAIDPAAADRTAIQNALVVFDGIARLAGDSQAALQLLAVEIGVVLTGLRRLAEAFIAITRQDFVGALGTALLGMAELEKAAKEAGTILLKTEGGRQFFGDLAKVRAELDEIARTGTITIGTRVDIAASQQNVAKLKGDIFSVPERRTTNFGASTDAYERAAAGAKASAEAVPASHVTVFTADDTTFAASVARIQATIASVPKRFTVSGDLDTSGVEDGVRRVGNLIPRSPAKEGPLSHVPDWQYLLANLPDVMGQMVDVVTAAGKRIGAGAQVEAFQALAAAISAGAGAVKSTVEAFTDLGDFTRPNAEALDEVAAAMRAVLTRLLALGRGFGEQAAEQVQRVAGAASAAVGALGATIDTIAKAQGFTPAAVDDIQKALDSMIFVLGRLAEMGAQFGGQTLGQVTQVAGAARTAMEALGAAVTAGASARGFDPPTIDDLQAALDRMVFVTGRLSEMGVQFSPDTLAHVGRLGDAIAKAFEGLASAVEGATAARGLQPATVHELQTALDRMIFVVGRLSEMGVQFSPATLTHVEALGSAIGSAFGALGEAVTALTGVRGFKAASVGAVDAILAELERIMGRMRTLAGTFAPAEVAAIQALGEAIASAFGGIGAALQPLRDLRGFVAPAAHEVEAAFKELESLSGKFRDLAITYEAEHTEAMERLGNAASASFGALGAALDVLPRLAETRIPDVEGALTRLGEVIRKTVDEIKDVARLVGEDAANEANAFAEKALTVIDLLGRGVAAFADLPGLGEVSQTQIARFGAGVQLAVRELARLAKSLADVLTTEAVTVSENISKALGVLGAAASLQDLNEFVAPSDRQIRNFVNALLATVDRLIEATRGVEPEVARRTGEIGESIAAAMGGLGAGVSALADIADFDGGKGFEAKLRGVIGLIGTAIATMRGLAGVVGDGGQLTGIAAGVTAVAGAINSFLGIAGGDDAADQIGLLQRTAEAIAGIPGGLLTLRYEVAFAATVNVNVHATGDGAANQAAAGEVAPATAEALKAEIWQAVANSLAFRGRF